MATKPLYKKLLDVIKKKKLTLPWGLLDKSIGYQDGTHKYALRKNTMPPRVSLYGTILDAVVRNESKTHPGDTMPFVMVERRGISSTATILEAGMPDGTSLIIEASKDKLRATIYEEDGTRLPTVAFKDMDDTALSCFVLALLPDILAIDESNGGSLLGVAMSDLGKCVDSATVFPWTDKNDIPDIAKEAAYYLDAAMAVMTDVMDVDCGSDTSDTPAEIEDAFFRFPGNYQGGLISENLNDDKWTPLLVKVVGKARKYTQQKTYTIADAKVEYATFSAHRSWTAEEQAMIPTFPDTMPVMPEVIRMANRISQTRNDANPVCNLMWRGETGFGKSTGMRQLACILNAPFLTQTCFPSMETTDFKSIYVPATEADKEEGACSICTPRIADIPPSSEAPEDLFCLAAAHVASLSEKARKNLLSSTSSFYIMAVVDQSAAENALFGKQIDADLADLCTVYTEIGKSVLRQKEELERNETSVTWGDSSGKPQFVHVIAPYMQAMTKGYIVEVQEASRIRDSGVLVSLNEFDRPGAKMQLMNGEIVTRHKDAICVTTDNVGYTSCRPLDPSYLRRQGMIIDSYDLSEEMLKDRTKRNTGVTDEDFLDLAYKLWKCVRDTCAQNSITDGSVSPVELERFVQAVKYDGMGSIGYNLDDCVISKATASIEDQKIIRTNCQAIYGIQ